MTPNRRRMLIAGGLVLALAVGGGAAAYLISTDSRAKEAGKSKGPPAVPVTVAAVTKETVDEFAKKWDKWLGKSSTPNTPK